MKNCSNDKCKASNPQALNEFYKDKGSSDGHKSKCKACLQESNKKFYSKNKNLLKDRVSKWKKNNPEKTRSSILKSAYGITLDQYNAILKAQDSRCAICQTDKPTGRSDKHFYVDHSHKTNKVRGLLCYHCNIALGMIKDSIVSAIRLVEYLKINEKK